MFFSIGLNTPNPRYFWLKLIFDPPTIGKMSLKSTKLPTCGWYHCPIFGLYPRVLPYGRATKNKFEQKGFEVFSRVSHRFGPRCGNTSFWWVYWYQVGSMWSLGTPFDVPGVMGPFQNARASKIGRIWSARFLGHASSKCVHCQRTDSLIRVFWPLYTVQDGQCVPNSMIQTRHGDGHCTDIHVTTRFHRS